MTLYEIIAFVDEVKPNAFSGEAKTVWLNELEYAIQANVHGKTAGFIAHDFADAADEEMLLPEAFGKVYYTYLEARIDAANGEWNEYANAMQLYNGFMGEYERWYARNFVDEP